MSAVEGKEGGKRRRRVGRGIGQDIPKPISNQRPNAIEIV